VKDLFDYYKENGSIPLIYNCGSKFNNFSNFGDILSIQLLEKLNPRVVFRLANGIEAVDIKIPKLLSIGTILNRNRKGYCCVWGTGLDKTLYKHDDDLMLDVRAVRGRFTAEFLRKKGYHVPEVYGDPAILIDRNSVFSEKKYELGIIPHLSNYSLKEKTKPNYNCFMDYDDERVKIISPKIPYGSDSYLKIKEINSCRRILSQSLHGCIIADTLGIPNLFFQESFDLPSGVNKLNILSKQLEHRYQDYISSFNKKRAIIYNIDRSGRFDIDKLILDIDTYYEVKGVDSLIDELMESFPINFE